MGYQIQAVFVYYEICACTLSPDQIGCDVVLWSFREAVFLGSGEMLAIAVELRR